MDNVTYRHIETGETVDFDVSQPIFDTHHLWARAEVDEDGNVVQPEEPAAAEGEATPEEVAELNAILIEKALEVSAAAEALDARSAELDKRSEELDGREAELSNALHEREAAVAARETAVADAEQAAAEAPAEEPKDEKPAPKGRGK